MNDEHARKAVVDEVAAIEAVFASQGLPATGAELETLNDRLRKLQNEAVSLQLPTTKIDELKLKVTSAMANPPSGGTPIEGQTWDQVKEDLLKQAQRNHERGETPEEHVESVRQAVEDAGLDPSNLHVVAQPEPPKAKGAGKKGTTRRPTPPPPPPQKSASERKRAVSDLFGE